MNVSSNSPDLEALLNNLKQDLEKRLTAINMIEELLGAKGTTDATVVSGPKKAIHHRRRKRQAVPVPTRPSGKTSVMVSDSRVFRKIREWGDEFTIGQLLKEFSGLTRADARGIISRLLKDGNLEQVEEGRGRKPAVYKPTDGAGASETQSEARA